MKRYKICLFIIFLMSMIPMASFASSDLNSTIENHAMAVVTDEEGKTFSVPVVVSEPVKKNVQSISSSSGLSNGSESYYQDFSVTLDKEAITRAGGTYSDEAWDPSVTVKVWGRLHYDKSVENTYLITRMDGNYRNDQPSRVTIKNRKAVVACTNDFNQASAQHQIWYPTAGFTHYTGFKYYAHADRQFSAIGGVVFCQAQTSNGYVWDVYVSMPIAGTNVLPGL